MWVKDDEVVSDEEQIELEEIVWEGERRGRVDYLKHDLGEGEEGEEIEKRLLDDEEGERNSTTTSSFTIQEEEKEKGEEEEEGEEEEGLPIRAILSLLAITFTEGITNTFYVPFLVFQVEWMGITKKSVGYYVGVLTMAFFLAQFCINMFSG